MAFFNSNSYWPIYSLAVGRVFERKEMQSVSRNLEAIIAALEGWVEIYHGDRRCNKVELNVGMEWDVGIIFLKKIYYY